MINYKIDINKATPYKEILISLREQSHALKSIHNPDTWNLSALTYALHLNDCLVLFTDLKERWNKSLPFDEAWDVILVDWKRDIGTAAVDICVDDKNPIVKWNSLCDIDYNQFLMLSEKFIEGKIPLTPITDFLKGKNTNIYSIVNDVATKLCNLFGEIIQLPNSYEARIFEVFYNELLAQYEDANKNNLYYIKTGFQPYNQWKASKTDKALPSAIERQITAIEKEMSENKTWCELWEENYEPESKTINHEGVARYIFINRFKIISNQQYTYNQSLDKLFYAITMIEYMWQDYEHITNCTELWMEDLYDYVKTISPHYVGRDFDNLWKRLVDNNDYIRKEDGRLKRSVGMFECRVNNSEFTYDKVAVQNIVGYMYKEKMIEGSTNKEIAQYMENNEKAIDSCEAQIRFSLDNSTFNEENTKKIKDIIDSFK